MMIMPTMMIRPKAFQSIQLLDFAGGWISCGLMACGWTGCRGGAPTRGDFWGRYGGLLMV